MLRCAVLCYAMLCYAVLCCAMLCGHHSERKLVSRAPAPMPKSSLALAYHIIAQGQTSRRPYAVLYSVLLYATLCYSMLQPDEVERRRRIVAARLVAALAPRARELVRVRLPYKEGETHTVWSLAYRRTVRARTRRPR